MLLELRGDVDELSRTLEKLVESIEAVLRQLTSVTQFPGECKKISHPGCGMKSRVCWVRDETSRRCAGPSCSRGAS